MSIRHALPADVDTLADIEAASYPSAEGASRQSIAGRVAVYPDCFWLLDEGGELVLVTSKQLRKPSVDTHKFVHTLQIKPINTLNLSAPFLLYKLV